MTENFMIACRTIRELLQRHVAFAKENPHNEEERWGKIANPTVHIGLNQIRKVVNTIIKRYGHPAQIVLELARELKQNRETKERVTKEQSKNQKQNDQFKTDLSKMGLPPHGENLLRMKLWKELNENDPCNRRCPYTGDQIGMELLFSNEVQIEHILPFAQTLDDSFMNKTLSMRRANRVKENRTPYEAFGESQQGYDWQAILQRVSSLPKNKKERFAADAMQKWLREDKDFLARHLTDTQYLSRIAREYLTAICAPNEVTVTPGRLTALLRGKWGLNKILSDSGKKERTDHRHHAVDAAVIAVTDRSLLQKVSTAASHAREKQLGRILEEIPWPFPTYREEVQEAVQKIVCIL